MRFGLVVGVGIVLSGALVRAEDLGIAYFPPRDGPPPALGTVVIVEKGKETVFTTFDFSIGAFDASAWFGDMGSAPTFALAAYPDADPDKKVGRILLSGQFTAPLAAGSVAGEPVVAITINKAYDGRRWTSEGGKGRADLVIDRFEPEDPENTSGYARVTGHFNARICSGDGDPAVVAPNARCRDITGQFDTQAQYQP